ncbi:PEFG-CTERM sorting domain-containing protein [Nitrosopumilus sp.]|nr:PEFG-CTERM sorting domain-containing protein [Nitrosopumilus sp.]
MKTQLMIFALFGILITSIGVAPVSGENDSITVITDKSSYSEDESILISGEIKYLALGDQLTILITSPNGNIAEIDQVTAGPDKKFNTEITPNGAYWKISGTYVILVTQDENNQATTSFEFSGAVNSSTNELDEKVVEDAVIEDAVIEDAVIEDSLVDEIAVVDSVLTATTVTVQDSTDLISYEITNAKLLNVIPDLDAVSLLIYIETTDEGSITLTIPRSVLDASINGGDDEFFVLVDGEEVDFEEITTSVDRTLTIDFLAGTEQIEIIGTFVIPEFGTIAAMILAVAIISIVAISAKSRLNMLSSY